MKQFVVYFRVSTRGQADSGLGLDAQRRDVDLYLATYAETPFEILAEFTDVASGKTDARPELEEAIQLAEQTGATLLVAKLDRLSRKVSFVATLMERKKLNLTVASMPNADKFQLHIYAALAEQEREFISLRTKQALAAAKARGVALGGNRGSLDAANAEAKEAAQRRAQSLSGIIKPLRDTGKTLQEIANTLNATGVKTARGGRWYPTSVKNALARL